MLIERREDEDMTAFTMRRVRADILEQAARKIEKNATGMPSCSRAFREGYSSAARAIRQMAEEE